MSVRNLGSAKRNGTAMTKLRAWFPVPVLRRPVDTDGASFWRVPSSRRTADGLRYRMIGGNPNRRLPSTTGGRRGLQAI